MKNELVAYHIEKDTTGNYLLKMNGQQSVCPFQTVVPTQTTVGGIGFFKQACTTQCPLASIQESEGTMVYNTYCGTLPRNIKLKTPDPSKEAPVLSIISS